MSSEMIYAVHTRTCTYLLDEDGVCRWIVSPTGMVPPDVRLCVGAQFVACLDGRAAGGLIGELRIGATALFVRSDAITGKMVLLRTRTIENVEHRRDAEPLPLGLSQPDDLASEPMPFPSTTRLPHPSALPGGLDGADEDAIELDSIDLLDPREITVTLTMPLFRPDGAPAAPLPPRAAPPTTWRPPAPGSDPGRRRR
jgi:hypothetical protein